MTGIQKTVLALGLVGVAIFAGSLIMAASSDGNVSSNFSGGGGSGETARDGRDDAAGYHPSDEILDPHDLSANSFKWKGHSGILDTRVSMAMPNGQRAHLSYPGGGLRFERMIDEHTATYSVLVGGMDVIPDGEIAVLLPDSDPPTPARPWRVFVEGSIEGTNAMGGAVRVTAVRFEGYYEPTLTVAAPAEVGVVNPVQEPASATPSVTGSEARSSSSETVDKSSDASAPNLSPESTVRQIGGSVSAPIVILQPPPDYSSEGLAASVTGDVLIYCQVNTSGDPIRIRVLRGLGFGLDEKAMEAVSKYRFKPAMEDGHPVTVELNVRVSFKMPAPSL